MEGAKYYRASMAKDADGSLRARRNATSLKWHMDHPEYHQAQYLGRSNESLMLQAAKKRAKERGLPFNLREADIAIPDSCPVLGMPLRRHNGTGPAPDSPSLDRVIPELGYVPGNVIVISWRANNLKRDATIEELEAVIAYMRAPASDGRQLLSDMHSGPRRAGCHGPAQTEPI